MTHTTSLLPAHVFRAYDIRGFVDTDFTETKVFCLGQACGTLFQDRGETRCAVGRDCRASSPAYRTALIEGLLSTGMDVVDVGMVPTPILYFAVKHLNMRAGVMVTASHNPSEYNGFKIWSGESTLYTTDITALRDLMERGEFRTGRGLVSTLDVVPAYYEAIASRVSLSTAARGRPLKVVVDGGNGAGGEFCVELLTKLGAEVIPLFCEPDGSFPNHHPDPVVEANMAALKAAVLEHGADCGIGLDGDADRIGAVDETGHLFFGDELLALYAREVLSRKPGAIILGDVKCSHRLFRDIENHGGTAEMYATGHSIMKARMREIGAALGGEMSGHMFFEDRWYGFDDAIYAAARLVELLSASAAPFSSLLEWPQTFITPELHVPCPDAHKFAVVEQAKAYFRERYQVLEIDGARLVFPDGWGLVRASNTQAVLVLRFEAESQERLDAIRAIVETPLAEWIAALPAGAR